MKTFIYQLCQKSITNKTARYIESCIENTNSRAEANLFMFNYFITSLEDENADNFFKLHYFSKKSSSFNYFFKVIEIFENYVVINNKLIILYSFLTEFIKKEHSETSFVFNIDNKRTEHIYQPISFFESINQIKNTLHYFNEEQEDEEVSNTDYLEKIIIKNCGSSYCKNKNTEEENGDGGCGKCECVSETTTIRKKNIKSSDYRLYSDEIKISKNVKSVDFFFSKYCVEKFLKRKGFSNFNHPMLILSKKPLLKINLNKNEKYIKKKFLEHFFELNEFKNDGFYEIEYLINTVYIFNNNYDFHIEEKNKEILINKKETINFLYNYYDIIKSFKTFE